MSDRYMTIENEKGELVQGDLFAPFFQEAKNPHSTGFVIEIVLLVLSLALVAFVPFICWIPWIVMIALPIVKKDLFKKDTTQKEKIEARNEFIELLIAAGFIDDATPYENTIYCECINLDPVEIIISSTQHGKTVEQIEDAASKGLLAFDALEYSFERASVPGRKNVYKVTYKSDTEMDVLARDRVAEYGEAVG